MPWCLKQSVFAPTRSGEPQALCLLSQPAFSPFCLLLQDLIKVAAETGGPKVLDMLLSQKLFEKDKDELDEAVDNALKVAAELGKADIVDSLLKKFPEQTKQHCKAGMFRALK